jgi:hypothetical protein
MAYVSAGSVAQYSQAMWQLLLSKSYFKVDEQQINVQVLKVLTVFRIFSLQKWRQWRWE